MIPFKNLLHAMVAQQNITKIVSNSQEVEPGFAFIALKGQRYDGNNFISEATQRGASLIITDSEQSFQSFQEEVPILLAPSLSDFTILKDIAEVVYKNLPPNLIAVTGTNGKTSVVHYIQQIFALLGMDSAQIGTCGAGVPHQFQDLQQKFSKPRFNSLTTPDIFSMYEMLNELYQNNIQYAAFEATSHALEQGRIAGIKAQALGFTSFSSEHLDYHGTMENYLAAKLKLFTNHAAEGALCVINSDMYCSQEVLSHIKRLNLDILTYGLNGDLKIEKITPVDSGQKIHFSFAGQDYLIELPIFGNYQAYNILAAALLVNYFVKDFSKIARILSRINAAPGRLERVSNVCGDIFIDFAHSTEALEKALEALLPLKKANSRLIVVFGCGGDRDKGKRAKMGEVASKLADIVIITDDNPRNEDPGQIRNEIKIGARNAICIEDGRKNAINYAISIMQQDDLLVIAGKGHENYQIIGDIKYPFSDHQVIRDYFNENGSMN